MDLNYLTVLYFRGRISTSEIAFELIYFFWDIDCFFWRYPKCFDKIGTSILGEDK